MRVRLKEGKQQSLILHAKGESNWKILANKLKINQHYLSYELKNEKRLLDIKIYDKLKEITKEEYDKFIMDKLEDNWGKSKGGKTSNGSTIEIPKIKYTKKLAEFIGAVLGDGNITSISKYRNNKKLGVYHIKIAGDLNLDKNYHTVYLKNIVYQVFKLKAKDIVRPNERFLCIYSKQLINFLKSMKLINGDKIKNQITIPSWIWKKDNLLKSCLRGLIDTDGCIFRMSKKDPKLLRISFTNYNKTLLEDTRRAFIQLGYRPSKIINNKHFFLSRQDEIRKYLKEIGFSNEKHIDRLNKLKAP